MACGLNALRCGLRTRAALPSVLASSHQCYSTTKSEIGKGLVGTYARPSEFVLHQGKGTRLWDEDGKCYLDFNAGIAVNVLGHADPGWVKALTTAANTLTHTGNLYETREPYVLAQKILEHTNGWGSAVFFCNSGTEANEAALKFARLYARRSNAPDTKIGLTAFDRCFHGRSMGALSLTAKAQYREPFQPMVPGVTFATYNSELSVLQQQIDRETTCGIFVEPVQGEGGVRPATPQFLRDLRTVADEAGALLIYDEVQCGIGRTGTLWAHDNEGLGPAPHPDIMTLAKPLAGGLPAGAVVLSKRVTEVVKPGDHGTTFGSNPLIGRVGAEVMDRVTAPGFLENVRERSQQLMTGLQALAKKHNGGKWTIKDVRGMGLLLGVEFEQPVAPLLKVLRDGEGPGKGPGGEGERTGLEHPQGVLAINAGDNVMRICPPLVITEKDADLFLRAVDKALGA